MGVDVGVGIAVGVSIDVGVSVGPTVGVSVGSGVAVGGTGVSVSVGSVWVAWATAISVAMAAYVAVASGVRVGVGTGEHPPMTIIPTMNNNTTNGTVLLKLLISLSPFQDDVDDYLHGYSRLVKTCPEEQSHPNYSTVSEFVLDISLSIR